MYTFTDNLSKEEYDNFFENYSMASFLQEYNWANVKENWTSYHCGLYKDGKLIGICLALVRKIFKNLSILYVARGYLMDFTNYEDLKEMTNNIKKLAKKNKAYMVKIDPNFCISDNSTKGEDVEHHYSNDYEIKNQNLLKLGYKSTGIHKEMEKNWQPQYSMFAPTCDKDSNILTESEILKTYKGKVRYYIGDFHKRRGVTFEITDDVERVDKFIELLEKTEEKQNIKLRNKDYFVTILKQFKKKAYLFFGNIDLTKYLEYLKNNNSREDEIKKVENLIKEQGNNLVLSAGLLILPGNKKGIRTSEYLYAGNNPCLSNLNVSTGLVFEMVRFSQQNNCHYCDLGGIDGNLNDHLSIFKQKFNGRIMEFAGEYDLPVSWLYYPIHLFYPILLKIYKKIRKRKD